MSGIEDLETLIQQDVDDVLAKATTYPGRKRFRLMRVAAEHYGALATVPERSKTLWALQVLLASTKDRQLPTKTGVEVATTLAAIAKSRVETPEVRHRALDSLALVFVKARSLSEPIDRLIRVAFISASRSDDLYMSEFALDALSEGGLLTRRTSSGTKPAVFASRQDRVESAAKMARRRLTLPFMDRNKVRSAKRPQATSGSKGHRPTRQP
jgi:hypothetical protein